MSKPENPKTVIIKNQYYPSGLTEEMVWNHYQSSKEKILKELNNKSVIFFVFTELNEYIIRRKINNNIIKINKNNYDKLITGRTVSLSMEMDTSTNYICLDIDPSTQNDKESKDCLKYVISVFNKVPMIKEYRIFNSANGFHIHGLYKNKMNVNVSREVILKYFRMIPNDRFYLNERVKKDKTNIDFSPNYNRGSHTVPFSLCRNGLMCLDVTKNWKSFNRNDAVLRG